MTIEHRLPARRHIGLTAAQRLGITPLAKAIRTGMRVATRGDRRLRSLLSAANRRLTWSDEQWLVSDVVEHVVPATVGAQSYVLVKEALAKAGVSHVVISYSESSSYHLAILDSEWSTAVGALSAQLGDRPFYVDLETRTGHGNTVLRAYHVTDDRLADALKAYTRVAAFRLVSDAVSKRTYGRNAAVILHRWSLDPDGMVRPDARNPVARFVDQASFADRIHVRNRLSIEEVRLAAAQKPDPRYVEFPIDAVYLWVDGADPRWRESFAARLPSDPGSRGAGNRRAQAGSNSDEPSAPWRFRDRDELRYSLRSLEMYAPWIRNVYLVTDDQAPTWLNLEHPRLRVVSHRSIFADPTVLPVFNSHAISSQIHHIDGLSEYYLYMNDDVLFSDVTDPELFFSGGGTVRFRPSTAHSPIAGSESLSEIDCARMNAANLLQADFGKRCSALFSHTPFPQVRSVAHELEDKYPQAYHRTMRSRFRSRNDVETNCWLQLNYLLLTGRAVESAIRYDYFEPSVAADRKRLSKTLAEERVQVLCLNDGPSEDGVDYEPWLRNLLDTYYPRPSSFELPEAEWRTTTALPIDDE